MFQNLLKSTRNLLAGTHMVTIKSYYDSRFPPTKFLQSARPELRVRCILSGFPRTGTHWVRNVLEKNAGLCTYAVAAKGPLPQTDSGIVVKVHARNKTIARCKALWLLPRHDFDGKYIYSYRDPRDAILSLYEMYKYRKGRAELSQDEFLRMYDPIGQYRWEINAWVLRDQPNILKVKFENLKQAPIAEFQRIFSYLGVEGSHSEEVINQPVASADGASRPRRSAYGYKTAPPEYFPMIEQVSTELREEILALEYEPL